MHRYIHNMDMEKNLHADHKWAQLTLAPTHLSRAYPAFQEQTFHASTLITQDWPRSACHQRDTWKKFSLTYTHTLFIGKKYKKK